MPKKIYININRCIYCRACEVACEVFNGVSRINVLEYQESVAIPMNCRHCEKAPCMEICPTKALQKDEDGAVVLNPLKCIGCMMCAIVCPFGIPEVSESYKIMIKCDMCAERRSRNLLPACVSACPTDALVYGDLSDIMRSKREGIIEKVINVSRSAGATLNAMLNP